MPFVRAFLEHRFGTGQVTLSILRAGDVVGFVQHEAPGMNRKRAKLMTTALRSFLHYVRYRDEGMPDLVAAVPIVANWSMDSVSARDFRRSGSPAIDQHRSHHPPWVVATTPFCCCSHGWDCA